MRRALQKGELAGGPWATHVLSRVECGQRGSRLGLGGTEGQKRWAGWAAARCVGRLRPAALCAQDWGAGKAEDSPIWPLWSEEEGLDCLPGGRRAEQPSSFLWDPLAEAPSWPGPFPQTSRLWIYRSGLGGKAARRCPMSISGPGHSPTWAAPLQDRCCRRFPRLIHLE